MASQYRLDTTRPAGGPAFGVPLATMTDVSGNAPKAFIIHHTAGRGDVGSVINTLRRRGLGVQYIMDRDGQVYQVGGPGAQNIQVGSGIGAGLSNRNIVGMEVIANDDSDVTPAQAASAQNFMRTYYPNTPIYGHGQVNPGHKQATEGMTIVNAVNADRKGQGGINSPAVAGQGYTPDQTKAAFLSAIASGESPGYDVMYGGQKFTDYSKHPHSMQPIFDPNHPGQVIGHADVAGRYQFKGSTWDELAQKYGYKDFSPATQDAAAWQYANDIFKQKTGGSLEEALSSNDPGRINAAAQVLNQTWTSLPGGKEQSKGYGNQTFYDVYSKGLTGAGGSSVHPPNPTVGTPGPGIAAKPDAPVADAKKGWWKKFGENLAENFKGGGGGGAMPSYNLPEQTKAVLAPSTPTTFGEPGMNPADIKRQRLAQLMAQLNSQKLWG